MTVAFKNCEAMRNLVTGRAVPQATLQVTAKPLGLDLGMEPELGLEPDLGSEPGQGMEPDHWANGQDGWLPVLVCRCPPSGDAPTERQT